LGTSNVNNKATSFVSNQFHCLLLLFHKRDLTLRLWQKGFNKEIRFFRIIYFYLRKIIQRIYLIFQKIFYNLRINSRIKELEKFHTQSSSTTYGQFSDLTYYYRNPKLAFLDNLRKINAELLKNEKFSREENKSSL
jgi:hypothetical protein